VSALYYEVHGEGCGRDLVLLHGWSMNLRVWDGLAGVLEKSFRLISVDLPGHGRSEWNPKAVRASAGSLFRMPVVRHDPYECIRLLREAGLKIWVADPVGAQDAGNVDLASDVALIIGNEGNGVPRDIAARADGAITIPCPGPVESLNASVAASVLLYEASRQRASKPGVRHQTRKGSAR